MNKSQVTRLDGIVENRLASVNNDKRHGATCYHNSKTISVSIRDTANNYSVAPNARTLFTQLLFKHLQQFDGPFFFKLFESKDISHGYTKLWLAKYVNLQLLQRLL